MELKARNVFLPEDMWKRLKVSTASDGISIKDGLKFALDGYLSGKEQERRNAESVEAENAQMQHLQDEVKF